MLLTVARYAHGRTEVQVAAVRVFMLRTISIYSLSYALFLRAQARLPPQQCSMAISFDRLFIHDLCRNHHQSTTMTSTCCSPRRRVPAPSSAKVDLLALLWTLTTWAAFYKQVIVDTIVQLSTRSVLSFINFHWKQHKIELNLSDAVLSLVYRQGLVWVR